MESARGGSDGRAKQILIETGTLLEGHFLLTSGRHSGAYVEKFRILQHPAYTQELCSLLVQESGGLDFDVVAGPTTGGIILAFEVARQAGVRAIFAEKEGEGRGVRRSLALSRGERGLGGGDILTT